VTKEKFVLHGSALVLGVFIYVMCQPIVDDISYDIVHGKINVMQALAKMALLIIAVMILGNVHRQVTDSVIEKLFRKREEE
jgi:hypothetical protein